MKIFGIIRGNESKWCKEGKIIVVIVILYIRKISTHIHYQSSIKYITFPKITFENSSDAEKNNI